MQKLSLFRKQGFTLIELLVVIAIIGILASIVLISITEIKQKAKRARALQDFHQIRLAADMYWNGDWCDEESSCHWEGEEDPPPFVPEFYSNWDASWYCPDCIYSFDAWDYNEDGKAGCAYIYIYDPPWNNYIYKNILCDDCGWDCQAWGYYYNGKGCYYYSGGYYCW